MTNYSTDQLRTLIAEKAAARRVQEEFDFPNTLALRLVRKAKTPDRTWSETAEFVIAEQKEES